MTVEDRVVVVGAGISGLVAARQLQRAGLSAVVYEASDEVGGRIRTDIVDGFQLDRGFQVLLPAYPELRRQASLTDLKLRAFTQGAAAATEDGLRWLAGPWHGRSALKGSVSFALRYPAAAVALSALAARDAVAPASWLRRPIPRSTGEELRRWGVSRGAIEEVMRPFLAGVFLDPALETPARQFHLIWRCFMRGGGSVPADGMQALPRQLAADLTEGSVITGAEVDEITESGVRLRSGEDVSAATVIVATDGSTAARLLPEVAAPQWHAVTTFYYRAPNTVFDSPTLLVDGRSELLLNTVVLSDAAPEYAPPGEALVVASVPGHADESLESAVRQRLGELYGSTRGWELLATYPIPRALPVSNPNQSLRQSVRVRPGRYVCGDHRDTSSIQGALVSGRRAATAVLKDRGMLPQ
ncbi:NAD(P)/FAD-dependent oxidoreductase [Hoyosella subflava]|uniref:Putative oxidoreductase with NAD-binding domain n=1 Tax=Hoyosella subflava (strain DSM 45089 / JCM 17490 / NBRC 109087 / DQS3-9A1) TaxID=443218 RepID=F6EJE0_HOYSD|nr:NAD(P)/FAD-dependent oxidoreductase [Hoyosella subflava]AEF42556.1 Putative oxidoreductase with NAD-binding domain [Hoyosella subflava DQS3-9A1]